MAVWVMKGGGVRLAGVGLLTVLSLVGCNRKAPAPDVAETTPAPAAKPDDKAPAPKVPPDPRMHQPFAEATRADPPTDAQRPPDTTAAGKPTGKLCTQVQRLWDTIKFVSDDGKPINYSATVETNLGSIEIAFRPDLAPNHVRNFIALAKAGYYDGLRFERIVHEQAPDQPDTLLDLVEAGCPTGTGEPGYGSIGYWLKPELSAKAAHEPGTVGACHGPEIDSAACRFYVVYQCKTKALDGNYTVFGKVTKGLDVVRRIFEQPVRIDEGDFEGHHRPEQPVVIKRVTVHAN
ncbi:MAG TPA: peptidylprolyl isomerase [Gemmataceae bacterium]|nr:peptidylprolyl isomerase [Gemmataceae bacterium]